MLDGPIRTLVGNLESLRDFVDTVDSFLSRKREKVQHEHEEHLSPVFGAIDRLVEDKLIEEEGDDHDEPSDVVEYELNEEENSIKFRPKGEMAEKFNEAMDKLRESSRKIQLLYNGSLMNLVSHVELYFSNIIHFYLDRFPGCIGESEKQFSLEDLDSFESIEDARQHLIQRKVEDVLYGPFEEWVEFLRNRANLSMGYLDDDLDKLVESFQRRNLVVHAGNRVNQTYLSKVDEDFTDNIDVGQKLRVDREYLDDRIDLLEKNCLLIGFELWKQIDLEDEERGLHLVDLSFEHLKRGRYNISESLGYFLENDRNQPEPQRLIGKINYWLSLKRQGRWDEVKESAESADFGAKGLRFRLAHASLCERDEDFFELLEPTIKSTELTTEHVRKWPVFKEMRETDELEDHLSKIESQENGGV